MVSFLVSTDATKHCLHLYIKRFMSWAGLEGFSGRDTSAQVPIFPLYLIRHVRDKEQNYQTPVDILVIHTPITCDKILG